MNWRKNAVNRLSSFLKDVIKRKNVLLIIFLLPILLMFFFGWSLIWIADYGGQGL